MAIWASLRVRRDTRHFEVKRCILVTRCAEGAPIPPPRKPSRKPLRPFRPGSIERVVMRRTVDRSELERSAENTASRLIDIAVSLMGSVEPVIKEMKSSTDNFREYRAGTKKVPPLEYDRLISIIIREQGNVIAKNRELLAKLSSRK
jgi:hypothetical protein